MNILVIGGGGREHTLAWKLAQGKNVEKVFCAPGNPGMKNIECVPLTDFADLAKFAKENHISLTVVGPEAPLCDGIVDYFRNSGLKIFGPGKNAAVLEGSKIFAKKFMNKYGIATAEYAIFTQKSEALNYLETHPAPIVIKADGLAAGKGVFVAMTKEDAKNALDECFSGRFGDAANIVVIEECLQGEEASILAFVDGETITALASSQDHKRAHDNDEGPNTGGMGAYSPAPIVTNELMKTIQETVLNPVLKGLKNEGLYYRGIIYAGLMISEKGPKVLEFNVRFGDPETQAVLFRMENDLADAMLKTVEGKLSEVEFKWSTNPAVCVVIASGGYPDSYKKGHIISGLDAAEENGAVVFHAGTSLNDNKEIVNTGGRVLGVTASGNDIQNAVDNAYSAVKKISWQDSFYRNDIAHRAIK